MGQVAAVQHGPELALDEDRYARTAITPGALEERVEVCAQEPDENRGLAITGSIGFGRHVPDTGRIQASTRTL